MDKDDVERPASGPVGELPVPSAIAVDGSRGVAVRTRDGSLGRAELADRAGAVAAGLADLGVAIGDPVLVVADNTIASLCAMHGVQRAGAVLVAVPAAAGAADVAHACRTVRPVVGLHPPTLAPPLVDVRPAHGWHGSTVLRGPLRPPVPVDPDAVAVVLFTSGTTARPKGVRHSRRTLDVAAANFIRSAELTPADRLFLVSPLASITGVLQALVMAPALGATVVLEDRWHDQGSLDLLLESQATFYGGPDVVVARLLAAAERRGLTSVPLRCVALGGTMLDAALLRRAEHDWSITVIRSYGSSEAPFSTATPRTAPEEERLTTDGRLQPGVEVRLGTAGDPQECAVRGPHLFLGYVDAEDDADAFEDGWFRTGDVATLEDGCLRVVGRIKDVAVRNGMKVSLVEVETAVAAIDGIDACAAYRVDDEATGERVGVAVQAGRRVDLDHVVAELRARGLATYKLPEELVRWDGDFPRTATGKVRRDALADPGPAGDRDLGARLRP